MIARSAVGVAMCLLSFAVAPIHAALPPTCTTGTYVVTGEPLVAPQPTPPGELVEIVNDTLAISTGCPAVAVKLKGRKDGSTKLTARWKKGTPCDALGGRALLKGTLSSDCKTLSGTLKAKKADPKKRTVAAALVVCGDSATAGPEECDDGNTADDDACTNVCQAVVCGDGKIRGDEACDDGAANSDTTPDACRTDCTLPACGDGVHDVDAGEACDDANAIDDDGCVACSAATCLVPVTHLTWQAALDDAACPVVWVLDGTYQERVTIARDVEVRLNGVGPVILDGDTGGTVVTVQSGTVKFGPIEIVNGQAAFGGGMRIAGGDVTLAGTKVHDNTATGDGAAGGGIAMTGGALELDGAEVTDNVATGGDDVSGGGLYVSAGSVALVNGAMISDNLASAEGTGENVNAQAGGVYFTGTTLTLDGASGIESNEARARGTAESLGATGGGVYLGFTFDGLTMTLSNGSRVHGNRASAEGAVQCSAAAGGVFVAQSVDLTLTNAAITANVVRAISVPSGPSSADAFAAAGGLDVHGSDSPTTVTLVDSTVSGNTVTGMVAGSSSQTKDYGRAQGGGLRIDTGTSVNLAEVRLIRSTLSGNTVAADGFAIGGGAALHAATGNAVSRLVATNSTISGNSVDSLFGNASGGGIDVRTATGDAQSAVVLSSVTLAGNVATGVASEGGGMSIIRGISASTVPVTIRNTIIGANTAGTGPDCHTSDTAVTSAGYNLVGTVAGCTIGGDTTGNVAGMDPLLGSLADNGGPTLTRALMEGSPAIDGGNPAGCADDMAMTLTTDQRGMTRAAGLACDIGAVEQE